MIKQNLNYAEHFHGTFILIILAILGVYILSLILLRITQNLVPGARKFVVDNIHDSVIMLDNKNRIVTLNSNAYTLFQCKKIPHKGRNSSEFFHLWAPLRTLVLGKSNYIEFEIEQENRNHYYQASCSIVRNNSNIMIGKLITIHDNTKKKEKTFNFSSLD